MLGPVGVGLEGCVGIGILVLVGAIVAVLAGVRAGGALTMADGGDAEVLVGVYHVASKSPIAYRGSIGMRCCFA